ncbi:MAG TPA: hypothetical protein VIK06_06105 [Candidatus Limnocylindrales bacterium]|jgi:uncharacterized protein (UPF0212 family)
MASRPAPATMAQVPTALVAVPTALVAVPTGLAVPTALAQVHAVLVAVPTVLEAVPTVPAEGLTVGQGAKKRPHGPRGCRLLGRSRARLQP